MFVIQVPDKICREKSIGARRVNAFSYLLTILQNSFSPKSRDRWVIFKNFFQQTLNWCFSYIRSTEKKFAKFDPWMSTVTLKKPTQFNFHHQPVPTRTPVPLIWESPPTSRGKKTFLVVTKCFSIWAKVILLFRVKWEVFVSPWCHKSGLLKLFSHGIGCMARV